jgi:hypothetical protein
VASRASSTLEGSLPCKGVDPNHSAPMDMAEGPSAVGDPATENPAPVGGADGGPAPEGVGVGSLSAASMDVHVGSPQSGLKVLW